MFLWFLNNRRKKAKGKEKERPEVFNIFNLPVKGQVRLIDFDILKNAIIEITIRMKVHYGIDKFVKFH